MPSLCVQVPERFVRQLALAIEADISSCADSPSIERNLELGTGVVREDAATWLLQDAAVRLAPSVLTAVFMSVNKDYVADHEVCACPVKAYDCRGKVTDVSGYSYSLVYTCTVKVIRWCTPVQ